VDAGAWKQTHSIEAKVREDVKSYMHTMVAGSAAFEERCITDVTLVSR